MNRKMKAGFIALLCLFGAGFAMNGDGAARQELPMEIRAQFMEAAHTGDYETAMALHGKYGIGGKKMEHAAPEMFQLKANIFEAMGDGDWMGAVQLQDQFRELARDAMDGMPPQPGPGMRGRGFGQPGRGGRVRGPPTEIVEVAE